jgi:hypothetical protein
MSAINWVYAVTMIVVCVVVLGCLLWLVIDRYR